MLGVTPEIKSLSAPPSPSFRITVPANINSAAAKMNSPRTTRLPPQLNIISVPSVEIVSYPSPSSPTFAMSGSAPSSCPNTPMRSYNHRRGQLTRPVVPSRLAQSSSAEKLPATTGLLSAPQPQRSQSEPPPEVKRGRRVKLGPGYSTIHWARKTRAMPKVDNEERVITDEELSQHCTEDDAWMAVHGECALFTCCCCHSSSFSRDFATGRVYNVTPYMKFHPGGICELMRGAGQDATILFDEVWRPRVF